MNSLRRSWYHSMAEAIDRVSNIVEFGDRVVADILRRYDADCPEQVKPYDYQAVFGDLLQAESDFSD